MEETRIKFETSCSDNSPQNLSYYEMVDLIIQPHNSSKDKIKVQKIRMEKHISHIQSLGCKIILVKSVENWSAFNRVIPERY